jgi:hypothetical protein
MLFLFVGYYREYIVSILSIALASWLLLLAVVFLSWLPLHAAGVYCVAVVYSLYIRRSDRLGSAYHVSSSRFVPN